MLVFASCMKQEDLKISSELHIMKSFSETFEEILHLNSKFHESSALNKKLGEKWENCPVVRWQWAEADKAV